MRTILVATILLSTSALAFADQSECNRAIEKYNSAISDISSYLRRYTSCLNSSNGHDDCSSEFRRIKSSQDDFEDAVREHGNYCRS